MVGGDHDGQRFVVLDWEARFLRGSFGVVGDSAITVARGNGKSALVAAVAAAVIDPSGPLHGRRREVVVVAASLSQARIIFEDVVAFLGGRYNLDERKHWRSNNTVSNAELVYRPSGARIRCIGANPKTAHGLRPWLALLDEPAQWPVGTAPAMLAALRTSLGKVSGSRLIALGTRPSSSLHWFAKMLEGGADYAQLHAARPGDPPFQRRTWARANPSMGHLPELERRIRKEADDARRDPELLPSFEGLRLNLGVSEVVELLLLDARTWQGIEGTAERTGPYVLGVDLGGSAAMSAAAAYFIDTGALECVAMFPGSPALTERGLRDGVGGLYRDMHRRGELILSSAPHVVRFDELLEAVAKRWGHPGVIVADRWRADELRQSLDDVAFPRVPLIERGQGFKDGAEDVRGFRRAALDGLVTPVESLLLRSAIGEARLVCDPAGNAKLAKGHEGTRRLRARDDAAAASILAVAEGRRRADKRPGSGALFLGSTRAG